MHYQEYQVPHSLRGHIQCVWRLQDDDFSTAPQTIYPDGHCELIVHLKTPMAIFELEQGWRQQTAILFAGQFRSAIRLAARGPLDCIGIRLVPVASAAFVDTPLSEFRDRVVDLAAIDPVFSSSLLSAADCFAANPGDPAFWRLLGKRLLEYAIDPQMRLAVKHLQGNNGCLRIDALAADTGISLRSFQYRFARCVGMGAKQFSRILRLQATLKALDQGVDSLAQLANDAGFSDQAHATRELHHLTGLTPARLQDALRADLEGVETIRLAAAFVRGR
jgi:AraC-like DNA-binding protein